MCPWHLCRELGSKAALHLLSKRMFRPIGNLSRRILIVLGKLNSRILRGKAQGHFFSLFSLEHMSM